MSEKEQKNNKDQMDEVTGQKQQASSASNKWEKIISEAGSAEENQESQQDTDGNLFENKDENIREGLGFPSRDELENQLTAMEMKCDEYKSQMLRVQAEFSNMQKRAQRDVESAYKYSNEKIIKALLPIVDSLTRALETPVEDTDGKLKAMQEGIRLTLDMLLTTLQKFDVLVIDPAKGEPFNPAQHEAVSTQEDKTIKPHCIVGVLQKGYQLNDRVLRAAMVIVSAG